MGKYLKKNKPKRNIPLRVAAVLFYLTLCTTCLVSGLYARYSTNTQSSNQARVAKFSIKGDGILSQTIEAALIPGENETTSLNIHNNSEVAVEYTVTVSNETGNLPLHLKMTKTGSTQVQEGTGPITFTEPRLSGGQVDQYGLEIQWKAEDNGADWMGKVDHIAVTVTAAQID